MLIEGRGKKAGESGGDMGVYSGIEFCDFVVVFWRNVWDGMGFVLVDWLCWSELLYGFLGELG